MKNVIPTPISKLFAERAKAQKLNTKQLAAKSGLEYRLVLRALNGETIPHDDAIRSLAKALNIPKSEWSPLLEESRKKRISGASGLLATYLKAFIAEYGYIRPAGIAQTNKNVRVKLEDVFVSLSAETNDDRKQREFEEAENADGIDSPNSENSDPSEKSAGSELSADIRQLKHQRISPEVPSRILPFATLLSENQQAVVLGAPGAGKTTLLKWAGVAHARALANGEEYTRGGSGLSCGSVRLPIYVRVAEYSEGGASQPLVEYLQSAVTHILSAREESSARVGGKPLFEEYWQTGRLLILLDGLDEVLDDVPRSDINNAINELSDAFGLMGHQLIVSSRITGYSSAPLTIGPEFVIRDMNREQQEKFFNSWCVSLEKEMDTRGAEAVGRSKAQKCLHAIDANSGIRAIAVNPLLCQLIVLIQQTDAQLPERRVLLMAKATETLLRLWRHGQMDRNRNSETKRMISEAEECHILRPLALWIHEEKPSGLASEEELLQKIAQLLANMRGKYDGKGDPNPGLQEGLDAAEFLSRVRNESGILAEKGPKRYGFLHLLFEEFLAGLQIADDLDEAVEFIKSRRHEPRWEEPIRLGIASLSPGQAKTLIRQGILEEPSELEDILFRDLRLAARCLGDCEAVEPRLAVEVARSVATVLVDPEFGARVRPLREALIESAHGLKLHEASKSTLLDILIVRTGDHDWTVRSAAAGGLGSLGDSSAAALQALIALVKDEDSDVRSAAARGLGSVGAGSEAALQALIALAKDENWPVRSAAAEALGRLGAGSEAALHALIALAKDENLRVRYAAAGALGSIGAGSEAALQALIALARDENSSVRSAAARGLGSVGAGSEAALHALIALAKDEGRSVRSAAAEALGNVGAGSEPALQALIALTKDEDLRVRYAAARGLGSVGAGSEAALQALIALAKDEDSDVRYTAVSALDNVGAGSEAALQALIALAKDEDSDVRSAAAHGLGSVGSGSEAALHALIALAKDEDSDVRSATVRGLGSVGSGSEAALHALIALVQDKVTSVRSSAARGLGSVGAGSEAALHALIALAKDENWTVRSAAAVGLGSLGAGSEAALHALIVLAKDKYSGARSAAARGLGSLGAGSDTALQALIALAKDEDSSVRSAAWQSLNRLVK